jgi:hypothetical protein
MKQILTFDEVFHLWMEEELKPSGTRNVLEFVQKQKGFSSITEWRLNTALNLGLDKMKWQLIDIKDPNKTLPQVIVGPYQGWSKFFGNKFNTSFADAIKIPEFFEWCKTHDRINPIMKNFPKNSHIILLQKSNGDYIHIEGGHRICAITFAQALNKPIKFGKDRTIRAAIAKISNSQLAQLRKHLKEGSNKKTA